MPGLASRPCWETSMRSRKPVPDLKGFPCRSLHCRFRSSTMTGRFRVWRSSASISRIVPSASRFSRLSTAGNHRTVPFAFDTTMKRTPTNKHQHHCSYHPGRPACGRHGSAETLTRGGESCDFANAEGYYREDPDDLHNRVYYAACLVIRNRDDGEARGLRLHCHRRTPSPGQKIYDVKMH